MLGIVLAAGGGTRLRPLTDTLPKTLLRIDGDRTILELAIANLRAVGITDVVVVTGHAATLIEEVTAALEERYSVTLHHVFNDRYADWNNAYSLWLARDAFADAALLVNGDTVHPRGVEERLLKARGTAPLLLALDDVKQLGDEEMKVRLTDDGTVERINKALDPASVDGEYIGVSLIEPEAATPLADALRTTFERDPGLYYEDGYQQLADDGGQIRTAGIGRTRWVEVDNHEDLARAREIACHY
ncbi:MAG: phosphocholine cytidylyltransferase family protein [Actinobacteria bacterium]|nr:phosphocholine cytidylyltransferase family protein [Actinomycetota bacterium]